MLIVSVAVAYMLDNINETATKNLEKCPEGNTYKQSNKANRDASPNISEKFP